MNATKLARFATFHEANPRVYDELLALARMVRQRGYEQFGVRAIWERLRWRNQFEVNPGDEPFKLNDHFKELYARLVMAREPDMAGFFTVRRSQADEGIRRYLSGERA